MQIGDQNVNRNSKWLVRVACVLMLVMFAAPSLIAQTWSGWVPLGFPTGGVETEGVHSLIAVGQNLDGRLELFAISRHLPSNQGGADGSLWDCWQTAPNGSWSQWTRIGEPSGINLQRQIMVQTNLDGRLEVFSIGSNGQLWHIWQNAPNDGWSDWSQFPTPAGARFAVDDFVVSHNPDGRIEVFAKNSVDNSLWQVWQLVPNGGWSGWSKMSSPTGVDFSRRFAVALNGGGRQDVATIGSDNAFWHEQQNAPNDGWMGWSAAGTPPTGVDLLVAGYNRNQDARLEFFAVDGLDLWHTWETAPGTWSGSWSKLGQPTTANHGPGFTFVQLADGRQIAFAWGGDAKLWQIVQASINDGWGNWQVADQNIFTYGGHDIQVGRNQNGKVELFTYGSGDTVFRNVQR